MKGWLRVAFLLCATLLLILRIVDVVQDPSFREPPKPVGDGVDYENIGWHLFQRGAFAMDWQNVEWRKTYEAYNHENQYRIQLARTDPYTLTTSRPPAYPVLIAAIYRILSRGSTAWQALRIVNAGCIAIASIIAMWLTWQTLLSLQVSRAVSSVGVFTTFLLAALDRTTPSYAADFLTEPLAMLLLQFFVLFLCLYRASPRPWTFVGMGVTLGLMILTRSIFLFFVPGLWLILLFSLHDTGSVRNSWRARVVDATLLLLMALVLVLPWWMRNCIVLERWMPTGTQGPITLLGGYCDEALQAGGDWQSGPERQLRKEMQEKEEYQALASPLQREAMVADEAAKRVASWMGDHASDLPRLAIGRAYQLWAPYTGKSLIWKLLMVIGMFGLLFHRRWEAWWILGLPLLTTIVVMCLYSTGNRFMVPCYGLLYSLGGLGASRLFHWLGAMTNRHGQTPSLAPRE